MKQHTINLVMGILATVLLAGWAGCDGPLGSVEGRSSPATLPAEEDSAAYLDRLSSQETLSEDDALRGVLLLLDGKDQAATFEQRQKTLVERGIVPADWTLRKDRPITRGKFAYMVFRSMKLSGGVMLALTGPNQRYCLREMEYRKFMAPGFLLAPMSGMECIDVLTRADEYLRTGRLPESAAPDDE